MPEPRRKIRREAPGFDVTCVVGRVTLGEGEHTPEQAAFLLIADHGAPGTYSFPSEAPGTIRVTVEHELDQLDVR